MRMGVPSADTSHEGAPPAGRPRLLFVNQHYWPDVAATAQHLTDLAEHLAKDGFDVHVL
jgi:colanic acid biosynthesis glycosyl transferase WcaI